VLKKIAALGLTAAIAFSPLAALAQATPEPTPAMSPDAGATDAPKPMKKHKAMKHHTTKHMMKKKKMAEPAQDATPTDAPK
jgi:hypothetical protein